MTRVTGNLATLLIAGVMVSSQAIISANTGFIHETDTFMLALLLAVGAAYLCLNTRHIWMAASPLLLAASAGLYQSFLQAYVALVMIVTLLDLLRGERMLPVALRCAKCALALGLGMALCLAGYRLALGATAAVMIKKRLRPLETAAAVVILLLLPLGINCIFLIDRGGYYELMLYSYCLVNVYAVAVTEQALSLLWPEGAGTARLPVRRGAAMALPLLLALILFDKTVFANQLYLKRSWRSIPRFR